MSQQTNAGFNAPGFSVCADDEPTDTRAAARDCADERADACADSHTGSKRGTGCCEQQRAPQHDGLKG